MPSSLISVDNTAASSSDIVLTDGQRVTVSIKTSSGAETTGDFRVALELKDDAGVYATQAYLSQSQPALSLIGPGTWRARRLASNTKVGVFSA